MGRTYGSREICPVLLKPGSQTMERRGMYELRLRLEFSGLHCTASVVAWYREIVV
jgi:hypothetical protein